MLEDATWLSTMARFTMVQDLVHSAAEGGEKITRASGAVGYGVGPADSQPAS